MPVRFTTRAEMNKLFSRMGVEVRAGLEGDCNDNLDFYIDDATQELRQYIGQLYADADLNTSLWVRIRCTWVACYRLSQMGGNPSLFRGRYDQILAELTSVRDGLLPIPDLATARDHVPSMSNIEHDPRYREATLRVEPNTSTGMGGTRIQEISYQGWPELLW